ncbi:histidine phosphatase family protein [Cyanobium sp. ATX 6F1]|uniref:histidine phosphatase family protein n=2 Tax=unclassified Cyanobium TaxID=2627006 RepID=UPI0020CBCAE5|nr:histidine phosphatase family protein [Cyanobium sp. ATX 6F1]MCP9915458.1 histidine phosphatase family protein [Cyanobium sp. ATX 6F1]
MPLRIVLVRHGLSSFNLEHRIQGRDDLSDLTEEGVRQARATGAALKELSLTAAYSSPLSRAADTARHLLAEQGSGLEPVFDDGLLEVDLAPWSGLLSKEVHERFPEQAHQWLHAPGELELEAADGRRYRPIPELLEQAGRFIKGLLARHDADRSATGTVLVVAHNAILRCLLLHLLGRSANELRRLRVDNASISVLNLERSAEGPLQVQIESLNGTAHLGAGLPPKGAGQRLLLVRHGETDWNRQGRFQGQIDIPLNANGWAQAEAAGRFLEPVSFQRAYTSSMARPRQTAEAILKTHPGVPLTSVPALVEIGHGLWEGQLEQEIADGWPALLADWKRAPHTVQMPEGENLQQVWDRSLLAWNRIVAGLDPSETALVIAHDAVNKTILCALLGLAPADIWAVKQGNGGVTVIDYPQGPKGLPLVAALNLTAHLGGVIDRTAAGAL